MPQGGSDIPDLRLSKLTKLLTKFTTAPNLIFINMFGSDNAPSDKIEWESQTGSRGMAPFKAPGAKTPQTAPRGIASHSASAAFIGEKMLLDENFLNNLRRPGTREIYETTRKKLARELRGLRFRCDRRKEWMYVKMFSVGEFSYLEKGSLKVTVNYSIPTANKVTLTTNYKWGTGGSADIIGDIRDGKVQLKANTQSTRFTAYTTDTVLKYMAEDSSVTALLQKSQFGKGDLFGRDASNVLGVRPDVLGRLLDLDIVIYDESYVVETILTAVVTADSTTTISVADVEDFEVGGTLRFIDVSAGTYEEETISAVNTESGTLTVSSAPSTSYKAGEDIVTMTKTFLADDLFVMMASTVENQPVAEWMNAPFGNDRHYGIKLDQKEEWDPEARWIRAQNKGLPVLYFPEAVYIIDVE